MDDRSGALERRQRFASEELLQRSPHTRNLEYRKHRRPQLSAEDNSEPVSREGQQHPGL